MFIDFVGHNWMSKRFPICLIFCKDDLLMNEDLKDRWFGSTEKKLYGTLKGVPQIKLFEGSLNRRGQDDAQICLH